MNSLNRSNRETADTDDVERNCQVAPPSGRRSAKPAERSSNADPVEAVIRDVIAAAFASRPVRGAKFWHSTVVRKLEGSGLNPPSTSALEKRFAAERRRRRELAEAATKDAVRRVGEAVGDARFELLAGEPAVDRRDYEIVVSSITAMRSDCLAYAHNDYCDAGYRARSPLISREVFRELVFSPHMTEAVPHELMPEWWLKGLERRAAAAS